MVEAAPAPRQRLSALPQRELPLDSLPVPQAYRGPPCRAIQTAQTSIRVGAAGYLVKDCSIDEIADAKLEMVGLSPEDGDKLPSELSGGMTKRVALARALALDPAIVFLDEPTSGLDPIAAGDFDALIKTLQKTLGLTVFMVTHDLASLKTVCDRVAALADGQIVAIGPMDDLLNSEHPWVKAYFHGKRSLMLHRNPD